MHREARRVGARVAAALDGSTTRPSWWPPCSTAVRRVREHPPPRRAGSGRRRAGHRRARPVVGGDRGARPRRRRRPAAARWLVRVDPVAAARCPAATRPTSARWSSGSSRRWCVRGSHRTLKGHMTPAELLTRLPSSACARRVTAYWTGSAPTSCCTARRRTPTPIAWLVWHLTRVAGRPRRRGRRPRAGVDRRRVRRPLRPAVRPDDAIGYGHTASRSASSAPTPTLLARVLRRGPPRTVDYLAGLAARRPRPGRRRALGPAGHARRAAGQRASTTTPSTSGQAALRARPSHPVAHERRHGERGDHGPDDDQHAAAGRGGRRTDDRGRGAPCATSAIRGPPTTTTMKTPWSRPRTVVGGGALQHAPAGTPPRPCRRRRRPSASAARRRASCAPALADQVGEADGDAEAGHRQRPRPGCRRSPPGRGPRPARPSR